MKDLISIIVPVYNVEKYLRKCVNSIINQTYSKLEIILVDDGSTDNCGDICEEYAKKDTRIRVIHKINGGLSDARNLGIDVARGKYVSFIDSDDYVESNYIDNLFCSILKYEADMSISSHRVRYKNGTILDKSTKEECCLESENVLKRILYDDGIDLSAWAKLYKIELFKDIRFPKGRLYEDAATTYKLIDKSKKISISSKPTYNYIIRENSISNANFNRKKMDLILSTEEMCVYIKNKYPNLEAATERRIMYAYLSTLSQLAMSKVRFPEEEKILIRYIKKRGRRILQDSNVPIRDKVGILVANIDFRIYKIFWKMYCKMSGRR